MQIEIYSPQKLEFCIHELYARVGVWVSFKIIRKKLLNTYFTCKKISRMYEVSNNQLVYEKEDLELEDWLVKPILYNYA